MKRKKSAGRRAPLARRVNCRVLKSRIRDWACIEQQSSNPFRCVGCMQFKKG